MKRLACVGGGGCRGGRGERKSTRFAIPHGSWSQCGHKHLPRLHSGAHAQAVSISPQVFASLCQVFSHWGPAWVRCRVRLASVPQNYRNTSQQTMNESSSEKGYSSCWPLKSDWDFLPGSPAGLHDSHPRNDPLINNPLLTSPSLHSASWDPLPNNTSATCLSPKAVVVIREDKLKQQERTWHYKPWCAGLEGSWSRLGWIKISKRVCLLRQNHENTWRVWVSSDEIETSGKIHSCVMDEYIENQGNSY